STTRSGWRLVSPPTEVPSGEGRPGWAGGRPGSLGRFGWLLPVRLWSLQGPLRRKGRGSAGLPGRMFPPRAAANGDRGGRSGTWTRADLVGKRVHAEVYGSRESELVPPLSRRPR